MSAGADGIRMIVVFDETGTTKAYTRHHIKIPVPPPFVQGVRINKLNLPCVFEAEAYCTDEKPEMAHSKIKDCEYSNMKFGIFNLWSKCYGP